MHTQEHEDQYLHDVLSLGDKRHVFASCAIYSTTDIKLVAQGARVNSSLLEKLIQHKLAPPIEECLSVEGSVDTASLNEMVAIRLDRDPRFVCIAEKVACDVVLAAFRDMPLPLPLAFKLTLARESRPELFEHCLSTAIMSVYLRTYFGWTASDLAIAAAAGMYHDLGMLHIPQKILESGKPLTDSDRRYLYSHPLAGAIIVQQYLPEIPEIRVAISEHHERADGSGYPYGLTADRISDLGKVLMMADSGTALLTASHVPGSVALRLLRRKFDPNLFEWVYRLFKPVKNPSMAPVPPDLERLASKLQIVSGIFTAWDATFESCMRSASLHQLGPLMELIGDRIKALERTLLESGFVFSQFEAYSAIAAQDDKSATETLELANEAIWQIKEITLEARRRWADVVHEELDLDSVLRWITFAETGIAAP